MKIAPEGWPFIAGGLLLVMVLGGVGLLASDRAPALSSWLTVGAVVMALLTVFTAYFFRDPVRSHEAEVGDVLAPADGRIVQIARVDEPAFLRGPATRISIFLSIFDVHVQRAPITGKVGLRDYQAGGFQAAWSSRASEKNEQASLGIVSGPHRILVRQIAGLVARRIVTDPREGDFVGQGSRIGLIRFGSRVDLFIPAGWEVTCQVGDRAVGGQSVMARISAEEGEA